MNKPTIPSGWTRENLYPKYSRQDGQLTVTDRLYKSAASFHTDDMEAFDKLTFKGLYGSASQAEPNEAGENGKVHLTVVYSRSMSAGNSVNTDGQKEYTLEDGGQEVPIDRKKTNGDYLLSGYRTKWNYHLAAPDGTAVPSWWTTATDLEAAEPFRWVKEPDSLRDGEVIIKTKTKNAESYIAPAPVVVETRRYKSYTSAVANVPRPGTRKTPGRTFGYSGAWLVVAAPVRPDGRRWVAEIRYQFAPEWDTDIYPAGT
jgi:hypothetical protein